MIGLTEHSVGPKNPEIDRRFQSKLNFQDYLIGNLRNDEIFLGLFWLQTGLVALTFPTLMVWNGNGTEKDPQFSALVLTVSF